jgi:outer membrane protein OmpA-like peptidoglycan-associated protein
MPAAMLEFRNTKNELVHSGSTNSIGLLTLKNLLLEQKYKVNLKGINQALLASCFLYLVDSSGNRIRKFKFNEKGELELELLRFVYSNLPIIKNEDESVLDISIEGRIIPQQTRTTITKSPIAIIDKNGDVVAVAYTNETGYFKFDNIDPSAEYVFKLSESAKADRLVIFDNGKSLVLPILDNEGFYRRTKFDKAIELVNESGRALTISSEDVFIINRVYYELNSATLSSDSKEQLDQLSSILNLNPALTVELNAHTDSRGKSEYNYKLSESRAQSIVQYLVSKGIRKDRLSVKAWGETSLVNECTDQVVCEEGEHAVNRRTEIKFAQKK